MKYAIIENEEFARLNLQHTIEALRSGYECVFTAETISECIHFFNTSPDLQLIFMDIELGDGNCFEIFNKTDIDIPVIFTTAYDEYAIRAFKENSIDYILKPVTEEDLELALKKFERIVSKTGSDALNQRPHYSELASGMSKRSHERVLISNGDGYSFVNIADVAWAEAGDKYITLVLKDGTMRITDLRSLGEVSEVFPSDIFYQVSRSVIASIDSIAKVCKFFKGRLSIRLEAGKQTRTETLSAPRREDFLNWFGYSSR